MCYILKYIDVLFIDELGKASSEKICIILIILINIWKYQIPFRGFLIFGIINHVYLQPIKKFLLLMYLLY